MASTPRARSACATLLRERADQLARCGASGDCKKTSTDAISRTPSAQDDAIDPLEVRDTALVDDDKVTIDTTKGARRDAARRSSEQFIRWIPKPRRGLVTTTAFGSTNSSRIDFTCVKVPRFPSAHPARSPCEPIQFTFHSIRSARPVSFACRTRIRTRLHRKAYRETPIHPGTLRAPPPACHEAEESSRGSALRRSHSSHSQRRRPRCPRPRSSGTPARQPRQFHSEEPPSPEAAHGSDVGSPAAPAHELILSGRLHARGSPRAEHHARRITADELR